MRRFFFICICNKGVMMKRKEGHNLEIRGNSLIQLDVHLYKFKCLPFKFHRDYKSKKEHRVHGENDCSWATKAAKQSNIVTRWQDLMMFFNELLRHKTLMSEETLQTQKRAAAVKMGSEEFYLCMVRIQWCPLLLKHSCWGWHWTLKGLGPQGHWGKSPMKKKKKQGLY